MIYVEEKSFDRQIEFIRFLAGIESCFVCAWLYPESKTATLLGKPVQRSALEPVTSYENGVGPRHTELVKCSESIVQLFSQAVGDIVTHCDSLALYKGGATDWFSATIGHEGVCLVRDETLFGPLRQAGFIVSTVAPSWW